MRTLALIALACAVEASVHSIAAQVVANVEAGLSDVRYDGFLASAAASISPTIRWEQPQSRAFVSARGTYLRFESGRHSLDGSATGSWFARLGGRRIIQNNISAGSSQYANIASFSHTEAEARFHLMGGNRGSWIGATVGRSSFGGGPRRAVVVATGMWLLHTDRTVFVSLDRSFVGDTVYSDLRSSGRWRKGDLVLEGIVGARIWSRGGGRGVFGEGSATLTLAPQAAFVVSAGRYPTDVVSGSIAGRYVTVALRFGTIALRRPATALPVNVHSNGSGSAAGDPRLEIERRAADDVRITLYATGATSVDVIGDFTDWQPVALNRSPGNRDVWTATFRIARGVHRINVRRDGGPWMAPAGTTRSTDDYDGEVGVFVLP